jgi:hypothetical protein
MALTPIVELGVAEAYDLLVSRFGQTDLPALDAHHFPRLQSRGPIEGRKMALAVPRDPRNGPPSTAPEPWPH